MVLMTNGRVGFALDMIILDPDNINLQISGAEMDYISCPCSGCWWAAGELAAGPEPAEAAAAAAGHCQPHSRGPHSRPGGTRCQESCSDYDSLVNPYLSKEK